MPGGVIGVHTGLFLAANTESELAGVLGHEIGHVTQHHLARMLAKQKTDTFKNIAGIALALLVSRANPELAGGALTASSAAMVQRQLDYTREHEREADLLGIKLVAQCDGQYDLEAGARFMHRLYQQTQSDLLPLLSSHPPSLERARQLYSKSLELRTANNKTE